MKLKFTLLVLLLCPICSIAQHNWQALPYAPKSYRLDDFFFLNPKMGWAILGQQLITQQLSISQTKVSVSNLPAGLYYII